jgi:peptidoglycan-N-acetylglucosamine deacetylase
VRALAAAVLAGLAGCTRLGSDPSPAGTAGTGPAPADPRVSVRMTAARQANPRPVLARTAPGPLIDRLPGRGRTLALTVDDGVSSAVVEAYARFVQASGVRLTFFPNGAYPSWTEHKALLRPLVDSGQVQLGNHTWSHPNLLSCSDSEVAEQISRNERFLRDTFGVSGRPFLRSPFGAHSPRIDRLAAEHGYGVITTWYGSLGDSMLLPASELMANAREWLRPQSIVIGHANHPTVIHLFGQLLELIRQRSLQTVTLDDVFTTAVSGSR